MVVYDDTSSEPVKIYDSGASIADPENFGEYRLTYRSGDVLSPKIEATEPLSLQLDDFCAAIRGGGAIRSTPQLAIEVLQTIEAVDRSIERGGIPVEVTDTSTDGLVTPSAPGPAAVLLQRAHEEAAGRDGLPRNAPSDSMGSDDDDAGGTIGTAVLGAGPAGLTAAYVLGLRGKRAAAFEADGSVGGIAKTIEFDGFRFDLGGHRFFTKLRPIQRLWETILGDEFLTRPRLSRIYYNGDFFAYPLEARGVVKRLGAWESMLCGLSYLWALRLRGRNAETFEEWVTMRFGKRLYDIFFRSYTEKVWGIPGSQIRSQWAAQRIKDFSFWHAALSMLGLRRNVATTLIEQFRYPRLGPGQMWEALQKQVEEMGIAVHLNKRCVAVKHDGKRVSSVVVRFERHGRGVLGRGGSVEHPVERTRLVPRSATTFACRGGSAPAPLPGLLPRGLDDDRTGTLCRQLDLPARSRHARRPRAELRCMERRHGSGGYDLPRRRILLLPGRRHLEHDRQ